MTVPALGTAAPDFTLASTAGAGVTLSALRGRRVLLAFFPLAFTSTCTDELCAFRDDFAQFADADTVVLPISVDSVPTLKEYKARLALPLDLLSDFKREVSRAYGVLNEEKFYSNRAYILVDPQGLVQWTHVETHNGQRRSDEELLAQVRAA